jgi:hypothetical protein
MTNGSVEFSFEASVILLEIEEALAMVVKARLFRG